ncbi:MAG: NAD-glutamate dehydrogenase [Actinomycetes bacterium]
MARVSESVLARLHFVVRMPPGVPVPEVDLAVLEDRVRAATRRWDDDFNQALIHEFGEEKGWRLVRSYGPNLPESYKEDVSPRAAVADVGRLDALAEPGDYAVHLHETLGAAVDEHRFALYRLGVPVPLFELLPVFASLGAQVIEQRPYELARSDGLKAWIYDVGLRLPATDHGIDGLGGELADKFCQAFLAAWRGDCEVDRLNALVTAAGLSWREVAWIRALVQYARQLGTPFSFQYFEQVLLSSPDVSVLLVGLFRARLDPDLASSARALLMVELEGRIGAAIDAVKSLDADRILRQLFALVQAVLRTNVFQLDAQGDAPVAVAYKINPTMVPQMPAPVPKYEIWTSSPRLSGVHLRFGRVARGGLRWSDRPEDMRTEILGLVKAQTAKNSVIVPVGAKGGFFIKQPRDRADRALWMEDGIACYREFINSMLSITDNLVAGQIVPPSRTVRWDSDDSYLVVAADKGTASFSDIANEISLERGFWLGDAFASGGSHGYDHKEMGITARGAWESVKRHFRDLGVDVQEQPFKVAGIGDMSGDVFGNGMLLSQQIQLVAAFDHRHIFLDPNPADGAASLAERRRLFELPRSSWADYAKDLISAGGGVYSRSLKEVPITDEVRASLGLPEDVHTLTPDELVTAVLMAPVDLLWNGGIGTYVKATSETNEAAGDKANDAVRVNGADLRVRVVGEGGNLGLTQLGRVEAAMAGVQLNTDAIDNSAGVDCSDHEVNIKIALDAVVADGDLTFKQRNQLLVAMTDEVAHKVLQTNYRQNQLLGTSRMHTDEMMPVHRRLISWLCERGVLDRDLEYLPTDTLMAEREAAGLGLTSPELSVLISYVKIAVTEDLVDSPLAGEQWYERVLTGYFPDQLVQRCGPWLAKHPLRSEIIATVVANELVDSTGISFVFRTMEETGASTVEVARAYTVAREVFKLPDLWRRISELDGQVATRAQDTMALEIRRLLDRSTRWVLALRGGTVDVSGEINQFSATVAELSDVTPRLLVGGQRERLVRKAEQFIAAGAPDDLAYEAAASLEQFSLLDIDDIARRNNESLVTAAEVYFAVSEHYGIDALLVHIAKLPRGDRWSNMARAAARSDLYSVLAGLTSKVLRTTSDEDVAETRIAQWEGRNGEGQQRARATLAEIDAVAQYDLATLSVALRVLRTLVRQGS